ncbi:hypothetical protein GGX14DRAFT_572878 [Mycena pura]|uniref:Uncharacterized protein n=1 Tax=Mycena pura TaxID=153505 RepID=A0AAD6Y4X9_9AGAR|nr:hypothetical protein GGX14DRAFT_572878 [Mycena pura]
MWRRRRTASHHAGRTAATRAHATSSANNIALLPPRGPLAARPPQPISAAAHRSPPPLSRRPLSSPATRRPRPQEPPPAACARNAQDPPPAVYHCSAHTPAARFSLPSLLCFPLLAARSGPLDPRPSASTRYSLTQTAARRFPLTFRFPPQGPRSPSAARDSPPFPALAAHAHTARRPLHANVAHGPIGSALTLDGLAGGGLRSAGAGHAKRSVACDNQRAASLSRCVRVAAGSEQETTRQPAEGGEHRAADGRWWRRALGISSWRAVDTSGAGGWHQLLREARTVSGMHRAGSGRDWAIVLLRTWTIQALPWVAAVSGENTEAGERRQ